MGFLTLVAGMGKNDPEFLRKVQRVRAKEVETLSMVKRTKLVKAVRVWQ